jgi:hypothetical protein
MKPEVASTLQMKELEDDGNECRAHSLTVTADQPNTDQVLRYDPQLPLESILAFSPNSNLES